MYIYTAQAMREIDRRASEEHGISVAALMEAAGRSVAKKAMEIAEACAIRRPRFIVAAGKGNNGGDALVAARLLAEKAEVLVCMPYSADTLNPHCLREFMALPCPLAANAVHEPPQFFHRERDIILDGLLGTGFSGNPRPPLDKWLQAINASQCLTIGIDIPSGLDADTGLAASPCATADFTIALDAPKPGLLVADGPAVCGRLSVVSIGIPDACHHGLECPSLMAFGLQDARQLLCREHFDTYKNRRGHVLVAGGSADFPGAPFLTSEAALRAGCGLVTLAIPQDVLPFYGGRPRALIVRGLGASGTRSFDETCISQLKELAEGKSCLAIGPGFSMAKGTESCLKALLQVNCPKVLDADALNLLAKYPQLADENKTDWLLTPHPGEFTHLAKAFLPKEIAEARDNPPLQCRHLAKRLNAVILLKGPRTIVCSPNGDCTANMSGCPSLATAGSGDVLTGVAAALIASLSVPLAEAARLAAFIHGLAGESIFPAGSRGVIADDLPAAIASAIHAIAPNC